MTDISRLTRGLTTGINADPTHGAVVPPLHLTSTFSFSGFGECGQYDYTRSGNPTRDLLGEALATLEGGFGGTITSTGMSAIALCTTALLAPGDTIVVPHDCYGGSWRLFDSLSTKGQFRCRTVDLTDPDALAEALRERPKVVWVETPSNPLLRLTDVRAVADAAHAAGALVVADNTFLSPLLQRPIELGADVVVHSTTKYSGGHSDVVGGAVVVAPHIAVPEYADAAERIAFHQNSMGGVAGPMDSWLTLRGLKTLAVRMERHCDNAERVVEFLRSRSDVTHVNYPGLDSHPGHDVAAKQMRRFGGMVSFQVEGGEQRALDIVGSTRLWILGESLGGVESLIEHPGRMTHASVAGTELEVPSDLIRLSVGIEDVDDLVADLEQAMG